MEREERVRLLDFGFSRLDAGVFSVHQEYSPLARIEL